MKSAFRVTSTAGMDGFHITCLLCPDHRTVWNRDGDWYTQLDSALTAVLVAHYAAHDQVLQPAIELPLPL